MAALSGAAIAVPEIGVRAYGRGDRTSSSASDVHDMRFGEDGRFKIVQFTDTHYISGDPRSTRTIDNVVQILDEEKPDLVIHTGDIIFGNPAAQSVRELFRPVVERGIPFAVALGNHDSDFELSRQEIFDVVRSIDGNINSPVKEGVYGCSNDVIHSLRTMVWSVCYICLIRVPI